MYRYIIVRILLMIPTVFGAGILVFFLMRVIPGDICLTRWVDFGTNLDPYILDLCRHKLGLNKPILNQFWEFFRNTLTLDFGTSMWTGNDMAEELKPRLALSLQLAVMALAITILTAIPLGVIAAYYKGRWPDSIIQFFSITGVAIPSFWLGIMVLVGILIVTQKISGSPWMPPIIFVSPFENPLNNLAQLIIPAVVIALRYIAITQRMTRSAMLEILREDYVLSAGAYGLSEIVIMRRHVLRNAMLPVVTVLGNEFAFLIGGLVITEQVFNLNGIGALLLQSLENADYIVAQNLVMLIVLFSATINLVVDLTYAYFDPRIRFN